jgi:hypothetical protein
VAWTKPANFGAEFALVDLGADWLRADGFAIGFEPEPYRLEYSLRTASGFVTGSVVVAAYGDGWARRLELSHGGDGAWTARASQEGAAGLPLAGGDTSGLTGALDVDLGLSPLFNSMPVLRHRLHDAGGTVDFLMAWISVPDLSVHPSPQRYRHLERRDTGGRLVRFEAAGEGADFVEDITFDADGLVIDYPGIGTRVPGP